MQSRQVLIVSVLLLFGLVGFYTFSSTDLHLTKDLDAKPNDLIPKTLLNPQGKEVSSGILKGKYVGLYFSASWCGPCRSFTPKLIDFRNKHVEKFEVILIGGDGTSKDQMNYVKKYQMPWLSMVNQSDKAKQANKNLDVEFIPYLVILDPNGNVVSKDGVKEVRSLKNKAMDLWQSKHQGI